MSSADIDWDSIRAFDAEQNTAEFLAAGLPDAGEDAETFTESGYAEPSTDVIKDKPQTAGSKRYEKKVKGLLSTAFRYTVGTPATVPDSAAILYYEKNVSRAAGDLADTNDTFKRVLDFVTEGTDNAALAFVAASAPLALQWIRNHEVALEPKPRGGIKVPFTKGRRMFGGIRLGLRLGRWRASTHDPMHMTSLAFNDEGVIAALKKAGILVATPSANGRQR